MFVYVYIYHIVDCFFAYILKFFLYYHLQLVFILFNACIVFWLQEVYLVIHLWIDI